MTEKLQKTEAVRLIRLAEEARKQAYAPYSGFLVGAALLAESGEVYMGCNIENAAYGPSNCAERTAFFEAVSEGERRFSAIAVVGRPAGTSDSPGRICTPCGVCRQVMAEFCEPDFVIVAAADENRWILYTLGELLPESFGAQNLEAKEACK